MTTQVDMDQCCGIFRKTENEELDGVKCLTVSDFHPAKTFARDENAQNFAIKGRNKARIYIFCAGAIAKMKSL